MSGIVQPVICGSSAVMVYGTGIVFLVWAVSAPDCVLPCCVPGTAVASFHECHGRVGVCVGGVHLMQCRRTFLLC